MIGNPVGVDLQVAVHQDVPEPAQPLQLSTQPIADHFACSQQRDDVFVVLGTRTEVRTEDVIADIEEASGAQLQPLLNNPGVAEVEPQQRTFPRTDLFQPRDHLFELEETFTNRVSSQHHRFAP